MPVTNCLSLKELILQHLAERTSVETLGNLCVLTLPVRTFDNRLVDVFVQPRQADYFLVHDAGKAANEIILRGMNITESMKIRFERMAASFGIHWAEEMFQAGCKLPGVAAKALAVATCSAAASVELLESVPEEVEEGVRKQFGHALRVWGRSRAKIKTDQPAIGQWKQHSFDFVAYPRAGQPIAINILNPSGGPISVAERAAFRARDLEGTPFGIWRKVAVRSEAECWTRPSRELINKCSDAVIELNSGQLATVELIDARIGQLLHAA